MNLRIRIPVLPSPRYLSPKPHQIIAAYRRLLKSCSTTNQVYKLNIALENRLEPEQWDHIRKYQKSRNELVYKIFTSWIFRLLSIRFKYPSLDKFLLGYELATNLRGNRGPDITVNESNYRRTLNTNGVSLFCNPGNLKNRLLIVWTGAARRPMMPLMTFLSAVWHLGVDVLVIRAYQGKSYVDGIPGHGNSLNEGLTSIEILVRNLNYQQHYVLGTSMGTIPALLFSYQIKSKSVVLAGPTDPTLYESEYEKLKLSSENHLYPATVALIVGSKAEQDLEIAGLLTKDFQAEAHFVPDAGHNSLWPLILNGQFSEYLRKSLSLEKSG
jgi:hypothetical protein